MNAMRLYLLCVIMLCAGSSIAWGMDFETFKQKSTQLLEDPGKEDEVMALADAALQQGADGNATYAGFAYFVKCWIYARKGDFKAAHEEADRAIKHAAEQYAYMAKSLVYEHEGRYGNALRICLEGAAKLHSKSMHANCEKRYGGVPAGRGTPARRE